MSDPRRQHYLPQFYLSHFAGQDGLLAVFDRSTQSYRRGHPTTITVENYFYTFVDDDGTKDHCMEKWLSKLEGAAKPVFDKLERRYEITAEDRVFLSTFLGVLYCRVPRHEREINEILTGHSRTILRRNLQDAEAAKRFTSGTPEELLAYVESDKFALRFDHNYVVSNMIQSGRDLGEVFFVSDWEVLYAEPRTSFVTCDVPFGITHSRAGYRPVGVASPEATKAVPLSSRVCLSFSGERGTFRVRKARAGEVRQINMAVLREAERYAIARDDRHLNSLVPAAGLTQPAPLTQMIVDDLPDPSGDPTRSISLTRRIPRRSSTT